MPRPSPETVPPFPPPGWEAAPAEGLAVAGERVFWAIRPGLLVGATGPGPFGTADGTGLGPGLALHHDGDPAHLAVALVEDPDAPAGLALAISAAGFAGSYLSLAANLPDPAASGLGRTSILGIGAAAAGDLAGPLLARVNLRHGPNLERWIRPLAPTPRGLLAEFDLGRTPLPGLAGGWADLFLPLPARGRLRLRDLRLWHRLRASL